MQLLLNVKNAKVLNNLVWMLEHFKDNGVEIVSSINQDQPLPKYTDEYIEKNWKEMLLNLKNIPNDYKTEQYELERAECLAGKYR